MFYTKNVPGWERVLRGVIGITGISFAIMSWGSSMLAVGAGIAGAMMAITGLFGFCPMCAMKGRKLTKK